MANHQSIKQWRMTWSNHEKSYLHDRGCGKAFQRLVLDLDGEKIVCGTTYYEIGGVPKLTFSQAKDVS